MVGFTSGKQNPSSNLFHLLWSNYRPGCLWLGDYLKPSIISSQSRQTLSNQSHRHLSPTHHDELSVMMRLSVVSRDDRKTSSSPSLSPESSFDGNSDTELNHRDITLAKCTDVINSRYFIRFTTIAGFSYTSCSHTHTHGLVE